MLDVYQKFTRYYIIYIYTYVWKNKKEMKETRSHYLPSRLNKQKKQNSKTAMDWILVQRYLCPFFFFKE